MNPVDSEFNPLIDGEQKNEPVMAIHGGDEEDSPED